MAWNRVNDYSITWGENGVGNIHLFFDDRESIPLTGLRSDDFQGYSTVLQNLGKRKSVWYEDDRGVLTQSDKKPEDIEPQALQENQPLKFIVATEEKKWP